MKFLTTEMLLVVVAVFCVSVLISLLLWGRGYCSTKKLKGNVMKFPIIEMLIVFVATPCVSVLIALLLWGPGAPAELGHQPPPTITTAPRG